jgi:hypothetical protein
MRYIADAQLHEIASSELGVDSEVEGEARTIAVPDVAARSMTGTSRQVAMWAAVVEIVSMPSRPSISLTNFA